MSKITTAFLSFFLFAGMHHSMGQDHPAAEQKWHHQHHLMKDGRATGKPSKKNATRLRHDYRQVTHMEKQMRQHSWLSSGKKYSNLTKDDRHRMHFGKKNMHFLKPG